MTSSYEYSKESFIFETKWNSSENSIFDNLLTTKWKAMQDQGGFFRYNLKIKHSKILPGKYQYLAQLNLDRALLRRKPVEMLCVKQKFDPNTFNFTMMDKKEIIFEVLNKERKHKGNYLAINVSPLEFGHCLFLPALYSCLPQVVTANSLLAATELFLLSKSPAMRIGFNGLCAYASLNHLHFHLYYLQQQMLLETIEVEHLAGPCYVLSSFPSRGFVFQLACDQDIQQFVGDAFKLINLLYEKDQPYNVFMTRGSSFQDKSPGLVRDHVRLYVWARKPGFGAKGVSSLDPALCEMFGHLLIKNTEDYETLTEELVANIMSDLTLEPFQSVMDQVRQIFQ